MGNEQSEGRPDTYKQEELTSYYRITKYSKMRGRELTSLSFGEI